MYQQIAHELFSAYISSVQLACSPLPPSTPMALLIFRCTGAEQMAETKIIQGGRAALNKPPLNITEKTNLKRLGELEPQGSKACSPASVNQDRPSLNQAAFHLSSLLGVIT